MENMQMVIALITSAAVFIGTVSGFVIGLVKAIKGKTLAVGKVSVAEELFRLVEEAEAMLGKSGEEKKDFVLNKINEFAVNNKLPFDKDSVSAAIDNIVAFTKKINVK